MILLASFPFVTFYLHNINCRSLEAVWGDYVSSGFFREAVQQAVSYVQQYQVTAWIADDRRLGPMEPEDLAWVATDILPVLAANGLRRLAMVESDDWLNRTLIDEAYAFPVAGLPMELRYFATVPTARAWACSLLNNT